MSKKFQLQIPEPCHEDWDKMTPGDKGRFCDSCKKTVHDFTGMSDAQLIAFFKKQATGSVCGRFYNDQLERDFEIPRKRLPWIKYFLQLIIPAFLFTSKAKAQGQTGFLGDTVLVDSNKNGKNLNESCSDKPDMNKSKRITGKLVDEKGGAIPYATVVIKGTKSGVATDANGNFSIDPFLNQPKTTLIFSSVGFETKELIIDTNKTESRCNVELVPMVTATAGEIVVVGFSIRKKKQPIKLFQRIFKDSSDRFFKAYPNPVSAGSLMKIELNKAEAGEYQADLINQNGQIIHSTTLVFETENNSNSFNIPMIMTCAYFIRITSKKSGKKHTEKIIIQ
ncbi:MAG TPA: carboxypeptidase-like regulatory domain-containing protein [Chitinophagaceae bacterium]